MEAAGTHRTVWTLVPIHCAALASLTGWSDVMFIYVAAIQFVLHSGSLCVCVCVLTLITTMSEEDDDQSLVRESSTAAVWRNSANETTEPSNQTFSSIIVCLFH